MRPPGPGSVTAAAPPAASRPPEADIRRAAVTVVTVASLALGVTAGGWAWTVDRRAEDEALRAAADERVAAAALAVDADRSAAAVGAAVLGTAGAASVRTGSRAALDAAVAQAGGTLASSAVRVDDDAVRQALAAVLGAAEQEAATASAVRLRALAAEVAGAERAVVDAVAAHDAAQAAQAAQAAERAAAERAAAAASRPRATSPGAPAAPAPADRSCATTYSGPAFYTSPPTDGGDGSNGRLPASALTAVSWTRDSRGTPFYLRSDAAAALERLNAAFRAALGHDLALDLTYRDLDTQVAMRAALGSVAAVPGTSSHGTGLAIDVPELPCTYGWDTAARAWLVANGPAYGWVSPAWARQGGSNPEYWHYEYRG
ncbi:D-alanyl-D-alanine carboxypeptidase family protein [Cellulomonas sp. 179-A 9B4 NHS]|uniref:M15 family metallopeptidase n=1 Tax=Cellulomonas sp. 179-A 9B4 NHS TaxID=3142379 RepID=UPI0039A0BBD9